MLSPRTPTRQEVMYLIDWVNCLDVPSCTLVDSFEDLKSGIVVADILAYFGFPLQGIEMTVLSEEEAIENWNVILNSIRQILPEELSDISGEHIQDNQSCLIEVMKLMSELDETPREPNRMTDSAITSKCWNSPSHQEQLSNLPRQVTPKNKPPVSPSYSYRDHMQSPVSEIAVQEYYLTEGAQADQETLENSNQPNLDISKQEININLPRELPKSSTPQPVAPEKPLSPPTQTQYEAKPVPESTKEGIISWIETLGIARKGALDSQMLTSICRTGVILCDIINRLQGRSGGIKGCERNPKNRTQALTNVNKVLEFLRSYPKMNARYLWSAKEILQGDENVVWGLLEDMMKFYSASKKRPVSQSPTPKQEPETTQHKEQEIQTSPPKPPTTPPKPPVPPSPANSNLYLPKSFLSAKSNSLRSYAASHRNRTTPSRTPPLTPRVKNKHLSKPKLSEETKTQVTNWLEALELHWEETHNPLQNQFLNGVLLCELLTVLLGTNTRHNKRPRNTRQVKENFDKASEVIKDQKLEVPNSETLMSNPEAIYSIVNSLKELHPSAVPLKYQPCSLPYGAFELKKLESGVLNWLHSLEVIQKVPFSIFEISGELKSGKIINILVNKLKPQRIQSIPKPPKTEQTALKNIRKALEVLRKHPKMSQKFTWNEKEISKGNPSITLGLLEDLYRCFDGLPPRRPGTEYHSDGPYVGRLHQFGLNTLQSNIAWRSSIENSFNQTFGSIDSPRKFNEPMSRNASERKLLGTNSSIPIERDTRDRFESFYTWLDSLGIKYPPGLDFTSEFLTEFSNGVLLCDIISKVEKISIPKVDRKPRTRADCFKNIRKAFEILRVKPAFPGYLTKSEELVYEGDSQVVKTILSFVMKLDKNRARSSLNSSVM